MIIILITSGMYSLYILHNIYCTVYQIYRIYCQTLAFPATTGKAPDVNIGPEYTPFVLYNTTTEINIETNIPDTLHRYVHTPLSSHHSDIGSHTYVQYNTIPTPTPLMTRGKLQDPQSRPSHSQPPSPTSSGLRPV